MEPPSTYILRAGHLSDDGGVRTFTRIHPNIDVNSPLKHLLRVAGGVASLPWKSRFLYASTPFLLLTVSVPLCLHPHGFQDYIAASIIFSSRPNRRRGLTIESWRDNHSRESRQIYVVSSSRATNPWPRFVKFILNFYILSPFYYWNAFPICLWVVIV